MATRNHRKYPRIRQNFQVRLFKETTNLLLEGLSVNMSQKGAFIRTKNLHSLQVNDHTVIDFFLPPDFTGHHGTIALRGRAVVNRIDQENEGIGVEFLTDFKQFERHTDPA